MALLQVADPWSTLSPSNEEYGDVEVVVRCMKDYTELSLRNGLRSEDEAACAELWETCELGLDLLCKREYDEASRCFKKVGNSLIFCIRTSPINLFSGMLMVLGHPEWKEHEPYRQAILNFGERIARVRMGSLHPTTVIFQHLRGDNCIHQATEPALQVSLDVMKSILGSYHPRILSTRRCISIALRRQQRYDISEVYIRSTIADCELYQDQDSRTMRQCLGALATILHDQERCEEAEEICIETLRRGVEFAAKHNETLDATSMWTIRSLSGLARQRGEITMAEAWEKTTKLFTNDAIILHKSFLQYPSWLALPSSSASQVSSPWSVSDEVPPPYALSPTPLNQSCEIYASVNAKRDESTKDSSIGVLLNKILNDVHEHVSSTTDTSFSMVARTLGDLETEVREEL